MRLKTRRNTPVWLIAALPILSILVAFIFGAFFIIWAGESPITAYIALITYEDKEKAYKVLEILEMDRFANRQIKDLSGGQQQRIFVARALLQDADVYFFDEPFVCIDMATEKLIISLFKQLVENDKTIFVVHHDLNTVEKYFNWVVMLNTRLVVSGPTKEAYTMENLSRTFGQKGRLFEEVLKLTNEKIEGLK